MRTLLLAALAFGTACASSPGVTPQTASPPSTTPAQRTAVATVPAARSPDGTASASGDGAGSDDARVDDATDLSSKFRHAHDDEPAPPSAPSQSSYWRDLAAQVYSAWLVPTGFPVTYAGAGCFHLSADGKVVAVKLDHRSGDAVADASVEHALAEVQRARNEHPVIVPADQLPIIARWVCFKFRS